MDKGSYVIRYETFLYDIIGVFLLCDALPILTMLNVALGPFPPLPLFSGVPSLVLIDPDPTGNHRI